MYYSLYTHKHSLLKKQKPVTCYISTCKHLSSDVLVVVTNPPGQQCVCRHVPHSCRQQADTGHLVSTGTGDTVDTTSVVSD